MGVTLLGRISSQCRKVKSESEVTQLCQTLSDPMDCSPPGSSVHRIFQARVLEWGAIAFSEAPLAHRKQTKSWDNKSKSNKIILLNKTVGEIKESARK